MYRADLVDDEHAVIDARGRRRGDRMDKAIGNQLQPELLLDGGSDPCGGLLTRMNTAAAAISSAAVISTNAAFLIPASLGCRGY